MRRVCIQGDGQLSATVFDGYHGAMQSLRRIVARWLQLVGVIVALGTLNALTAQQLLRGSADEPQVQLARDAARALASGDAAQVPLGGAVVDVAHSLAPFIIVYDGAGRVQLSTAQLDGHTPDLPGGVLADVTRTGEARFTWQPAPTVRLAAVVVPIGDGASGYVLVGRSLVEVEARSADLWAFSLLGGAAAAALALALAAAAEFLMPWAST